MQLVLDSVPPSTYIGWEFLLGVDSLRNLQGDQSGALDPAHNMYWSWKTGYIFMRFKGDSPESPLGKLHFDVGGIKPQTNTIRSLSFAFQEPLRLRSGMVAEINVAVDLAHLFKGGETIDFANIYRCMGGPKAVKLADNYANGMFEMRAVEARQ
ncbi:MAG: hypothetical protein EAS52_22215 [Parapedobacter sp.]|nr:MAG: hypothetical protein EAS52_22215 [Parapedobacter sp.]